MGKDKFQERLLLPTELFADGNLCPSCAFFPCEWRQSVGNISQHIEEVAFLSADDLLHFGKLFMPEALLSKAVHELLSGIRNAPQCAQFSLILEKLRQL